jgi:hypothetical protein
MDSWSIGWYLLAGADLFDSALKLSATLRRIGERLEIVEKEAVKVDLS